MHSFVVGPSPDTEGASRVEIDGVVQRNVRGWSASQRTGERPTLTVAYDAEGRFQGDGDVIVIPGADAVVKWLEQVSIGDVERLALAAEQQGRAGSPGSNFRAAFLELARRELARG